MAMTATATTPSTHPTMMPIRCDGDVELRVEEEPVDVEGCREVVEGDSSNSTLCNNKIDQLNIN